MNSAKSSILTGLFVGICLFVSANSYAQKITFSKSLSTTENEQLSKSLNAIKERQLNSKLVSKAFKKYFDGDQLGEVENYLSKRIDLVVSSQSKFWLRSDAPHIPILPVMTGGGSSVSTNNPSLLLWIGNRWSAQPVTQPLEEISAMGTKKDSKVVQIGTDFGKYFPLYGLSLLVHEARHSDCEGGLPAADLSRWKNSTDLKELSYSLAKSTCGYSHSMCPAGTLNAGKMNCDTSIKGPYTYQYVFNRALVKACENCTFAEKALLQVFALEATSKMPLTPALSTLVNDALDRLPEQQKTMDMKELVNQVLEKTLQQVDDYVDSKL